MTQEHEETFPRWSRKYRRKIVGENLETLKHDTEKKFRLSAKPVQTSRRRQLYDEIRRRQHLLSSCLIIKRATWFQI